jgi:hypothetical protein
MGFMLASISMAFIWSPDWGDGVGGLVAIAVIIVVALLWYVREGRNAALENLLLQSEFGPPEAFLGTLAVAEHQPGLSIRLCKSTREARLLQFLYRWLVGVGRQAIFDEVTFDGSRRLVELKRKNKHTTAAFSEFLAIRMREIAGKRGSTLWHVELVPLRGRAIPFVTSKMRADRKTSFEQTAPVAKAASAIMAVPVQVFVAGNVWTLGWPPKNPVASS